jgi:hypothetical protein
VAVSLKEIAACRTARFWTLSFSAAAKILRTACRRGTKQPQSGTRSYRRARLWLFLSKTLSNVGPPVRRLRVSLIVPSLPAVCSYSRRTGGNVGPPVSARNDTVRTGTARPGKTSINHSHSRVRSYRRANDCGYFFQTICKQCGTARFWNPSFSSFTHRCKFKSSKLNLSTNPPSHLAHTHTHTYKFSSRLSRRFRFALIAVCSYSR